MRGKPKELRTVYVGLTKGGWKKRSKKIKKRYEKREKKRREEDGKTLTQDDPVWVSEGRRQRAENPKELKERIGSRASRYDTTSTPW